MENPLHWPRQLPVKIECPRFVELGHEFLDHDHLANFHFLEAGHNERKFIKRGQLSTEHVQFPQNLHQKDHFEKVSKILFIEDNDNFFELDPHFPAFLDQKLENEHDAMVRILEHVPSSVREILQKLDQLLQVEIAPARVGAGPVAEQVLDADVLASVVQIFR